MRLTRALWLLPAGWGLCACFMDGYPLRPAPDASMPDAASLPAPDPRFDATIAFDASPGADAALALDARAGDLDSSADGAAPVTDPTLECDAANCVSTRVCGQGCEAISCTPSEQRCFHNCATSGPCASTCREPLCTHDCSGSSECGTTCLAGTNCEVDCTSAGHCTVQCRAGATCWAKCRDRAQCAVYCDPGANCRISCDDDPASCGFAACSDPLSTCNKGVTCGGFDCPL